MSKVFVHINVAITKDGFMAGADGQRVMISSNEDWIRVHKLRAKYKAILVGASTVCNDDPTLLVKPAMAKNPVRIVLDPNGRVPADAKIFDRDADTIHVSRWPNPRAIQFEFEEEEEFDWNWLLWALERRGINSVLVEGGAATIQSLLDAGVWNQYTAFRSEKDLGAGLKCPLPQGKGEKVEFPGGTLTTWTN